MIELQEIEEANADYARHSAFLSDLSAYPSKRVAVLTCMDCRLQPEASLGLHTGEANVIRNAGGRASEDAIRSLAVSTRLLGATEILVIQHTDCGMETKTQEGIILAFAEQDCEAGEAAELVDWMTIPAQPETLLQDVEKLRRSPLISDSICVHGFLINPHTGVLTRFTPA